MVVALHIVYSKDRNPRIIFFFYFVCFYSVIVRIKVKDGVRIRVKVGLRVQSSK